MTSTPQKNPRTITRRRMLLVAGAGGAGIALAACGSDDNFGAGTDTNTDTGTGTASESESASTAVASGSGAVDTPGCVLTAEAIEGPFYTDVNLVRRDITEGRPGQKLELRLKVVDANGCTPLSDASVDVWHADATGLYSAFTEQGDDANVDTTAEKFLRGVQTSDADGVAVFDTIYPGWYRGRTTHVHVKVHLDNQTRVTTQLYFPDEVTSTVYGEPAYAERGQKDTSNATDDFGGDNRNLLMDVTKDGDKYIATGTLGINRS